MPKVYTGIPNLPTGMAKKNIDNALVLIDFGNVSAMIEGAMVE